MADDQEAPVGMLAEYIAPSVEPKPFPVGMVDKCISSSSHFSLLFAVDTL